MRYATKNTIKRSNNCILCKVNIMAKCTSVRRPLRKKKKNKKNLVYTIGMHTDLADHLHSNKCNDLVKALQQCHAENPFIKFFGACNKQDDAVVKCFKEERLARRKRNYEKSLEMKAKWKRKFKEDRQQETNA